MVLMLGIASTYAQTAEELKAQQGPKKDSIAKLQGEVDAIQAKIDALPGWKKRCFWYGRSETYKVLMIGILMRLQIHQQEILGLL